MRTITTTTELFQFDELSEQAQQKAIEKLWAINVDYEWWDGTYMDAERIGLKISGFDIDRGSYVDAVFYASAEETAHKIMKEHGETCETYKTAEAYLKERDELIDTAPKDEAGDFQDEYELDGKLDDMDSEFLKSLQGDYLKILRDEYEYLTSEEAIKETILDNEYEFTKDGTLS